MPRRQLPLPFVEQVASRPPEPKEVAPPDAARRPDRRPGGPARRRRGDVAPPDAADVPVASRPPEPHEAAPPDAARRPDRRAGGSARRHRGEVASPDAAEGPARSAEADETAARHFWGRRWQEHLEASPYFAKRLPGGRALCRTGVVSRVAIRPGRFQGMIVGGRPHYVDVRIRKLQADAWNAIRIACLGQIGSEDELREGRVSGHVRDILTDPDRGLFPAPSEVKSRCSCSDAVLPCKHVMAVLWGAGGRFDTDPFLLFRLRGVRSNDLVSDLRPPAGSTWRRDVLADDAVAVVFSIVLERGPHESPLSYRDRLPVAGPRRRTAPAGGREPGNGASAEKPAPARRGKAAAAVRKPAHDAADSWRPTGRFVTRLREQTGFTAADLAELLRVSPSTVGRWENTPGLLRLRPPQREALRVLGGEAGLEE